MSLFSKILIQQNWLYLLQLLLGILPCMVIPVVYGKASCAMAYRLGDPTGKLNGRNSISPLVQLEPVGYLLLLTTGLGWGRALPIERNNFRKPFRDSILVLFTGIASCLLLSWGIFLLSAVLLHLGNDTSYLLWCSLYTGLISLSFGLCQLLPYPCFGLFQVISPVFPPKFHRIIQKTQGYCILALAVFLWTGYPHNFIVSVLSVALKILCKLSFVPYALLESYF